MSVFDQTQAAENMSCIMKHFVTCNAEKKSKNKSKNNNNNNKDDNDTNTEVWS